MHEDSFCVFVQMYVFIQSRAEGCGPKKIFPENVIFDFLVEMKNRKWSKVFEIFFLCWL